MTYPEFREQEEEMKSAALIKFQEICDEDKMFQYFWFGVEFKAVGREEDDCPFTSGKYRGAFLAGMEWYFNKSNGNDYISPERIAGLTPTSNPGGE
jgi:hypothetical protein